MLRIKQIISLLAIVLFFNSCYVDNIDEQADATKLNEAEIQQYIQNNNLSSTIKKTTSGLYYAITDDSQSTGQAINKGDSVYVHFTARLVSGTLIDTTSEIRNRPDKLWIGVAPVRFSNTGLQLSGLDEGIRLMKEGQRATIIIPSNLGLGSQSNSFIPPYSVLVYDLKVINVKSQDEQIQEYLDRKKLTVTLVGDSGLRYIHKVEDAAGIPNTKPVAGQEIVVNYKGTFLTDRQFETSQDSTNIITIDKTNLIRGWHKGLKLMNQDEKSTLIIPYQLAYDSLGKNSSTGVPVPPYSPLVFEMSWTKTEKTRILDYIKTNAWTDTVKTTSSLYYRIEQAVAETNAKPSDTDSVRVKLTANYLLSNGSFSDPIYNNTLVDFRLNNTGNLALILGLKEGILLMRKGERRRLIMPSNLGFGSLGRSGFKVPGKTPVVYIVELVETGLTK